MGKEQSLVKMIGSRVAGLALFAIVAHQMAAHWALQPGEARPAYGTASRAWTRHEGRWTEWRDLPPSANALRQDRSDHASLNCAGDAERLYVGAMHVERDKKTGSVTVMLDQATTPDRDYRIVPYVAQRKEIGEQVAAACQGAEVAEARIGWRIEIIEDMLPMPATRPVSAVSRPAAALRFG